MKLFYCGSIRKRQRFCIHFQLFCVLGKQFIRNSFCGLHLAWGCKFLKTLVGPLGFALTPAFSTTGSKRMSQKLPRNYSNFLLKTLAFPKNLTVSSMWASRNYSSWISINTIDWFTKFASTASVLSWCVKFENGFR